jgi:hypothetical protein
MMFDMLAVDPPAEAPTSAVALDERTVVARPPVWRRLWRRVPRRRPVWWHEVVIILAGYWVYSLGRNAVPEHVHAAFRHGLDIEDLQRLLGLNFEHSVNRVVAAHAWLAQTLDYDYATLHFIVTPAVLIWIFARHPNVYRSVRTALVSTTLLCLAVFFLYPVAPPRLLSRLGYIDTVVRFHTWGSFADPQIAEKSNQYAAMPSLHMAWALWCGISLFLLARKRWVRVLGLVYPCTTLVVIIGTANHFLLDAVAGAAALGLGFGLQRVLSGHRAYLPVPPQP